MIRALAPTSTVLSQRVWVLAIGLSGLTLMPLVVNNPMLLHVWIMIFLAVAQGGAWNILGGYAGQHSIGHAAYFGMGAYSMMMSLEFLHASPLTGFAFASVASTVLAWVIGSITFRLRGSYFVLASISVAEIIRLVAVEWKTLTHGAEGILLTSPPTLSLLDKNLVIETKTPFYFLALGLAGLVVLINWFIRNSKLGYCLLAIREDQDAASALGIHLTKYKNAALSISAVLTAWSGAIWAIYVKFLDPNLAFGIDISVQMLLIAIIGGIGTVWGPVVGAFVLVLLSETLRNPKWLVAVDVLSEDSEVVGFVERYLTNAHVLVYGFLVVIVILFAKDGILGLMQKLFSKASHRKKAEEVLVEG
jgi:branched-chain amino acid transport system permease protein